MGGGGVFIELTFSLAQLVNKLIVNPDVSKASAICSYDT